MRDSGKNVQKRNSAKVYETFTPVTQLHIYSQKGREKIAIGVKLGKNGFWNIDLEFVTHYSLICRAKTLPKYLEQTKELILGERSENSEKNRPGRSKKTDR